MAVSILNAWTGNADYPTNGHTLAASAGDNRVGIVTISHEMNGGGGIGSDGGCVVTWGGQVCAEAEMDWCGGQNVYHDMAFIGYLTEAQVALMTDGIVDSVVITNGNGGVGPFGNSKIKTAFYQDVDQANIISASSKANTGNGDSSTATANNLTMGTLDTDVDEQVIMHFTSGQGATNGDDSYVAETGWTEEVDHVGDETNDHASSAVTRDSQANDDTLAVNFNCSSANRLSIVCISLGAAAAGGTINTKTLSDVMLVSDPADQISRARLKNQADSLAIDYSLDTLRKRIIEMTNHIVDFSDVAIGARVQAPRPADNLAVTEVDTIELRTRMRLLQDTLALIDAAIVLRERNRVTTDVFVLTDSIASYRQGVKSLLDILALVDSASSYRVRSKIQVDNIDTTDSISILRDSIRVLLSELGATDDSIELRKRYRLQADEFDLTDAATAIKSKAPVTVTTLDILAATDNHLELRQRFRVLADSLEVIDIALIPGIVTVLLDSLELSDQALVVRARYQVLADSFDVTDLALIPTIGSVLVDVLALVDSNIELRHRFRVLLDSPTVTDNVIATYVPVGSFTNIRTLSDVLELLDAVETLRLRFRIQTDDLEPDDSIEALRDRIREAQESFAVADASFLRRERNRIQANVLASTDSHIELRQRFRILLDSMDVIDSIIGASTGVSARTLLDILLATDAVAMLRERNRAQADDLAPTDALLQSLLHPRALSDALASTDALALLRQRVRIITDNPLVTDTTIATYIQGGIIIRLRTLMDELDVFDFAEALNVQSLLEFLIKHGIEELNVDHGIENLHILNKLRSEV